MEPTDRDYEHCGGCGCLSECGCSCLECRGAVRTMAEVSHGDGCGCTESGETLAGKLAAAELQLDETKNALKQAEDSDAESLKLYRNARVRADNAERLYQEQQKKTLMSLWHLLRSHAAQGMPPMIVQGIKLACRNVGMPEDHIASAELGGDTPDYVKQQECGCGGTPSCQRCGDPATMIKRKGETPEPGWMQDRES